MARSTVRRTTWLVTFSILAIALAGLFGAVVRQSWRENRAGADVVSLEAKGAAMLHPVTTLVVELVKARSAEVRGGTVDATSLRKAVAAVTELDGQYGAELQTTQRLTTLGSSIEAALGQHETGKAAFESYSSLVTLAIELERRIGDVSHLVHDPDLDSYYLMDAAVIELPQAMVSAGSAADLVAIAGVSDLRGDDIARAAIARHDVSAAVEAITAGLNKSIEFTSYVALGSNITDRLDAFKAAAADFAPPTVLNVTSDPVGADTLAAGANRVFSAANPLAHTLLGELQALLEQRSERLASAWRYTATCAGSAGLVSVAMIWLLATVRPRAASAADEADDVGDKIKVGTLAYARELLDAEELVHVGRSVRPRGRGNAL